MWNKIYLAVLGAAIVVMAILDYYANSWLGSIGAPQTTKEFYEYYARLASNALWISSFVLLLIANVLLWKTRRGWAMWTTFLYFTIFTIIQYFWLDQSFFAFKKTNGLSLGTFSLNPIIGVVSILAFGVIVFFDQFINLRLNNKMYMLPATVEEKLPSAEIETAEKTEIIENE